MVMNEGFSIASGYVDITPRDRIPLAGYAALRRPVFDRVSDPLEANVLVLRNGEARVVFVSLDLMYVGAFLRDKIEAALAGRVDADAIFLAAGHTHSGPPTEDSLPILGAVTAAYRDFVADRVVTLTLRLLEERPVGVSLEYREGTAFHSVNRRRRVFGFGRHFPFLGVQTRLAPNPLGPRDDVIRLIRIRDRTGKDAAICWSYACHPVGFPILNDLSADYPGAVRRELRAAFGDIPVIFWQGFSGNVGPNIRASADGVAPMRPTGGFVAPSLAEWAQWCRSLGQCVSEAALGDRGGVVHGPISCARKSLALRALGIQGDKKLSCQEIQLGSDLVICGVSAEVAVEYVDTLQRLRAPARVIPVGCVGDVYGYLPSSSMIAEGGYEVRGFVRRFGLKGAFEPNVNSVVERHLFRTEQ